MIDEINFTQTWFRINRRQWKLTNNRYDLLNLPFYILCRASELISDSIEQFNLQYKLTKVLQNSQQCHVN